MPVEIWGCGGRHIQLLLLLTCGVVEMSMQMTLKVSIYLIDRSSKNNFTLFDDPFRQMVKNWNEPQKEILINSWIVLGYIASFAGGWLTLRVNLKWFLLALIAAMTVTVYTLPHLVTHGGFDWVFVVSLLMGFIHGLKESVVVSLLAVWTPAPELGRCVSIVFTAPEINVCCIVILYNFLQEAPAAWISMFYLLGNMGVLWCVAWYTFGSQSPEKCFFVSYKERQYIFNNMSISSTRTTTIPWDKIFKTRAFYGAMFSNLAFQWFHCLFFRSNFVQLFLRAIGLTYEFNLYFAYAVVLSCLPLVQLVVSMIGEAFVSKKKYPARYVRKTCNTIAFWGGSIALFLLSYNTTSKSNMFFFGSFALLSSFYFQGAILSFFDIDRTMSGFMYGFANFIALLPMAFINNIIQPAIPTNAGYTSDLDSYYDNIWLIGAGSLYVGNFFYTILGTDEGNPMIPV